MFGNVSEISPAKASQDYAAFLLPGEEIAKAYTLVRDTLVLTNFRILTLDKQGFTGTKAAVTTIPYRSVDRITKESAGVFDLEAELYLWIKGTAEPMKWSFSKGVNVNEAYNHICLYMLAK